jgi:hypothetical protein
VGVSPPEPGSLSLVVLVASAGRAREEILARGVAVTAALVREPGEPASAS